MSEKPGSYDITEEEYHLLADRYLKQVPDIMSHAKKQQSITYNLENANVIVSSMHYSDHIDLLVNIVDYNNAVDLVAFYTLLVDAVTVTDKRFTKIVKK